MLYVVARDGSGDFTSVQEAVDAVRGGGRAPTILLVRPGQYRERVIVDKDNLRIIGEDRDTTVITWSACAKDPYPDGTERGTFLSFTLLVTGHNVEVENLTIRNDAGDGRQVGQAVAVYAAGDRGVWRGCRMLAHQDTLFCGPLMGNVEKEIGARRGRAESVDYAPDCPRSYARQYFEDCFIQGDIDFIFGPYRCWFERCTLFMNERGGWYTAANTPEDQPYGLVFHDCRLTGECREGEAFLGRPWRRFAKTLFLECEMDSCVSPLGFADWDQTRVVTERCGEYGTRGARADQSARHPRQKRLAEQEAACVTIPEVLGGWDNWRPDRRVPTWFLCGDSTMAEYPPDRAPMTGWGQVLGALTEEPVFVVDCAVNGRSSKSFIGEGRLAAIESCLRPGDKLIVSFGHNDEKPDEARHTDPETTFPVYLERYIDAAQRHGAEPILATPVARRLFDSEGRLLATHGAYPDAMRSLAERRSVRLIDMEKATMDLCRRAGVEGTKEIFCHVAPGHPNYPEGLEDNSHLQIGGAVAFAALFLAHLQDPALPEEDVTAAGAADCADLIAREDSVLR